MKKILLCLSALPLLALAAPASAVTCDEVEFGSDLTDRFPTIADACLDVVERDGQQYVHMKAELARRPSGNHGVFRFKHADGTYGPTQAIDVPPSWRARIEGRDYRLRDLSSGQELDVYIPPDRWAVHVDAPDDELDETIVLITVIEPREEAPMLPATASNMPLFALFGALALLGAGALRVARRNAA